MLILMIYVHPVSAPTDLVIIYINAVIDIGKKLWYDIYERSPLFFVFVFCFSFVQFNYR